jgi:hypothetical protein
MNKWLKWKASEKESVSIKNKEDRDGKLSRYLGMSSYQIVRKERLEIYWSCLSECIDERKPFIFQCDHADEADELKILTYTLVFQFNDIWEVLLDGLVVKAQPPQLSFTK